MTQFWGKILNPTCAKSLHYISSGKILSRFFSQIHFNGNCFIFLNFVCFGRFSLNQRCIYHITSCNCSTLSMS